MTRRGNGRGNGVGGRAAPRPNGGPADARRLLRLLNALGGTTFRRLLWQTATQLDLSFAQWQVLGHVERHPGCHVGEVARMFGVTLPAVTHILDRLAQKGLVGRAADADDRRVCVLSLTAAGRALVRELEVLQLRALGRVLGALSPAERRSVLGGLTTLMDAETRAAAGAARRPRGAARPLAPGHRR